jgi:hypothetical protein
MVEPKRKKLSLGDYKWRLKGRFSVLILIDDKAQCLIRLNCSVLIVGSRHKESEWKRMPIHLVAARIEEIGKRLHVQVSRSKKEPPNAMDIDIHVHRVDDFKGDSVIPIISINFFFFFFFFGGGGG